MKKAIRIVAVLLCIAVVLTGCGGGKVNMQEQVKKAGALRLLTVENSKPYSYQDADGNWQGIEIAIATKVAEAMGVPLEITPISRGAIVETFRSGGYHLAMGRIDDNESLRHGNATSAAYATGKLYVVTKAGNYMPTPGTLASKKVGVTADISGTMSIIVSGINSISRVDISDISSVGESLRAGGLSAYLCYADQARTFMDDVALQVQEMELLEAEKYVAVSAKEDTLLPGLVNQAVAVMTESGELAELYKQK